MKRWLLPLMMCATGCATEVDGDLEATRSEEQAINNQALTGTKICVRVKRPTKLYLHPEGNATIATTSIHGALLLTDDGDPRYVLVHRGPVA